MFADDYVEVSGKENGHVEVIEDASEYREVSGKENGYVEVIDDSEYREVSGKEKEYVEVIEDDREYNEELTEEEKEIIEYLRKIPAELRQKAFSTIIKEIMSHNQEGMEKTSEDEIKKGI